MIHIHQSKKNKQFWFTVTSKNGRVLVTSETYKLKASCVRGYRSLKKVIERILNVRSKVEQVTDHTKKK